MITSASNKGWEGDVSLEQRLQECGLEVPCAIERQRSRRSKPRGRARAELCLPTCAIWCATLWRGIWA